MAAEFQRVKSGDDISAVVSLGQRIWTEHYTPILAEGQVPYMLAHFHSEAIIREEVIELGYEYYLIRNGGEAVGYIGFLNEGEKLYLSKIYLVTEARGTGLGRKALDFVRARAIELGCGTIRLGVNKKNTDTIAAYERIGFRVTGDLFTDIGGGFVMDDFAMEWTL